MKKAAAFTLIMIFSFIFGYTFIMAKQVSTPKVVEINSNISGGKIGQLPVKKEIPPEDKASPPAKASVEDIKPSTKPETIQNGQATKNNTSNDKPGKTEIKDDDSANTSSKGYFVKVDISDQRTYVYKDGKLIRTMICSTGIEEENTKTPRGEFIINETGYKKGEWFFSNKYQEGAKYWVGFIGGTYLFHSIPMDADRNIIPSEAEKLGTPASHGCIRLSIEDAYWFYKNIPAGTGLSIQN